MRGTTAPRLLLELVCARMLLPGDRWSAPPPCSGWSAWNAGCRSPASAPAARPSSRRARRPPGRTRRAARAPAARTPRARPVRGRSPQTPAVRAGAAGTARQEYVRPSRAAAEARPGSPRALRHRPRSATDDWPETVQPGSGAAALRPPGTPAAPAAPVPARAATGEPDIPLPPEPTDDEDWPHPAEPGRRAGGRRQEPTAAARGRWRRLARRPSPPRRRAAVSPRPWSRPILRRPTAS